MSPPDSGDMAPLKRLDGEPVFDEAWQAQVLAMADRLRASGVFTPTQWSATLGDELVRAEQVGKPDTALTYYEAALQALERLLDESGAVSPQARAERRMAWEEAYRATPHGEPVVLRRG